jgi:cell wall assembly regulator SMI1
VPIDELVKVIQARGDASFGKGASAAAIKQAEKQLGVTFPPVLAEYLRRFGWLTVGSDEFYGLGTDVPSHLSLVENAVWEREQAGCPVPLNLIPIYNDGGGNLACVDVKSARGRVAFWDHERGPDQEPDEVAASLDAWLAEQIACHD